MFILSKQKILLLLFTLVCFLAVMPSAAWSSDYEIKPLTNGYYRIYGFKLDNGQVVWEEIIGNRERLFFYDGNSTLSLAMNQLLSMGIDLSNGRMVWQGINPGESDYDIFVYDDNDKQTVNFTDNDYWDGLPRIDDKYIIWYTKAGLQFYDGMAAVNIGKGGFYHSVSNGFVIWADWVAEYNYKDQIFLYKDGQTQQISRNYYHAENPCLDNGKITWQAYDGRDYEIYFYDGSQTRQLTDNNFDDFEPKVSDNQVVWTGYDGNDYEIYFYDGVKTIQLTDNNYYDGYPWIHNGNVVWESLEGIKLYDGVNTVTIADNGFEPQIYNSQIAWHANIYQIFLATPKTGLEILDGSDFSVDTDIFSEPSKLYQGGTAVEGAVIDGVTRLLLRLPMEQAGSVTFTLQGTGNPDEDGLLRSIDQTKEGNTITVSSVTVDSKEYAFAIYQAPEDFARQNHSEDLTTSERKITLKVNAAGNEITQDIKLVRPPVVLVHGLWSSSKMWTGGAKGDGYDFRTVLANSLEKIRIFKPNYPNDVSFDTNKEVIKKAIAKARTDLKSHGYAMVQADVAAHSMGGLLSRIYVSGEDFYGKGWHLNKENFMMGDINKLITLDTPHKGSFLADAGITCKNGHHSTEADLLLFNMEKAGYSISRGAVEDLMTTSLVLNNLRRSAIDTPTHAIVGHYMDYTVESYMEPDGTIKRRIKGLPWEYFNLQNVLQRDGYETVSHIVAGSDLVVSNYSQQAGLNPPAYYTLWHHHMGAANNEVLNNVVILLNTSKESNLFSEGFPVD